MTPSTRRGARLAVLGLLGVAAACDAGPKPPPFVAVADVKELMATILEPAAEVYWDAVGTIEDSTGVTALYPRSAEEWEAVRNSAYVVAEAGNLLMMPPRARDRGDWITMSVAMIRAGQRAIAAAEARDTAAVFDVGAELYETCTRCHGRYAIELMRPNAR